MPDAIVAICDTKDTGTDYNSLGVFRQYGQDYYFVDVVFKNIDPLMIDDLNAQCLVRNSVQIARFESNKEGSRTADKVQEIVRNMGGQTTFEKVYTTQNKETKIIVNSPWVIQHVVFPQPESPDYPDGYRANSEMGQFMAHLCAYSQLAKNPSDDAPDMMAMLAVRENPLVKGLATVQAVNNPFRSRGY
jgi:predicted phage terminase large subunit-like protein